MSRFLGLAIVAVIALVAAPQSGLVQPADAFSPGMFDALTRVDNVSPDEMLRRVQMQTSLLPAMRAIAARPSDFGGAEVEHDSQTYQLHIFYVTDNSSRVDVASLLPPDVPVVWTKATNSYAEIDSTAQAIANMGESFNSVGVDVENNQVRVSLPPESAAFGDKLKTMYDLSLVNVVYEPAAGYAPTTCTNRYVCYPYRGGILLTMDNSTSYCTWNLWAKSSNGALFGITAGHCLGTKVKQNGDVLVDCSQTTNCRNMQDGPSNWGSGTNGPPKSDARRFPVTNSNQGTKYNAIYKSSSEKAFTITSTVSWVDQQNGFYVCRAGKSGFNCGYIWGTTYGTIRWNGTDYGIPFKASAQLYTEGGDSGSPVLGIDTYSVDPHGLYGLATDFFNNGNGVVWSIPDDVEWDMKANFCLSDAC